MTSTTRIPPRELTGPYGVLVKGVSRRMFGKVPDSLGVAWHNKQVLTFGFGLGRRSRRWKACDDSLKAFAHMAVAAQVGCSFCLDLGYFTAHHEGLDLVKAQQVPRWREAEVFTPLERDVLTYAEAMTSTPPTVSDALSARLLAALGAAALLELTSFIALANYYSRSNVALGIEAEGLAASCALAPLASP